MSQLAPFATSPIPKSLTINKFLTPQNALVTPLIYISCTRTSHTNVRKLHYLFIILKYNFYLFISMQSYKCFQRFYITRNEYITITIRRMRNPIRFSRNASFTVQPLSQSQKELLRVYSKIYGNPVSIIICLCHSYIYLL